MSEPNSDWKRFCVNHKGFSGPTHQCPTCSPEAAREATPPAPEQKRIRAAVDRAFEVAGSDPKYHGKLSRHELTKALMQELAAAPAPPAGERLRRDLARLLDNLYGLHVRPGHLDAVLDVIHCHADRSHPIAAPPEDRLPPMPAPAGETAREAALRERLAALEKRWTQEAGKSKDWNTALQCRDELATLLSADGEGQPRPSGKGE